MGRIRFSGVVSRADDVLEMSGVRDVCEMCMYLAKGGVGCVGSWVRVVTNTPKHIANFFVKQLTNTQHPKQTDPLTGQRKTYKDTTLHTPPPMSKR